jgi:hypothetical protein
MGWSHITTNQSPISALVELLDEYKIEYQLIELSHGSRMLITDSKVYIETVIYDSDTNGHSTTTCRNFNREKLYENPIDFQIYWDVKSELTKNISTKDYNKFICPKNLNICKWFLLGNCKKGDKCDFKHEKIECKFFKIGKCQFGNNCKFSHETEIE